jgi:hypothetical protein
MINDYNYNEGKRKQSILFIIIFYLEVMKKILIN